MTKYNFLFKQQVIEFYLQNGKNSSLTRRHFQLAETTLERWINQFNHSRINGLAVLGKKRNYDRLSKHTQGEWHSTKYVKEGELFR